MSLLENIVLHCSSGFRARCSANLEYGFREISPAHRGLTSHPPHFSTNPPQFSSVICVVRVYLPSEFVLHKAFTATGTELTEMKKSSKNNSHNAPDLDLNPWRI